MIGTIVNTCTIIAGTIVGAILHRGIKERYKTILYASKYYLEIIWQPAGYDVWLAHYVKQTSYEGEYTIWQTGSIGRIDGCTEDVDTDILFKSKYPEVFGTSSGGTNYNAGSSLDEETVATDTSGGSVG